MSVRVADPLGVQETSLAGVWQLRWSPVSDERGSVQPVFVASEVGASVLPRFSVAQTNLTRSTRGAIRGIHAEDAQKMVAVLAGRVFAVAVDLRVESPSFGRHAVFDLGPDEGLFLSSGVGNAFQSVSDEPSLYLYMFDKEWRPGMAGVHVNALDAQLAIEWPVREWLLSEKDRGLPSLAESVTRTV